jgi:hypothetical protein
MRIASSYTTSRGTTCKWKSHEHLFARFVGSDVGGRLGSRAENSGTSVHRRAHSSAFCVTTVDIVI